MEDKKFQDFVVSVKSNSDIVGTISNYTQLKKSGKNFSGLCPFHMEKSPSFSVNAEKQFFYCFGCQAGGDVVKFVSMIDNLSYKEALIKLARDTGVDIPAEFARGAGKAAEEESKNRVLYNLLGDAASYFFKVLASSSEEATAARNYLYMRGLTNEDIEQYMLGYCFMSPGKFKDAVIKSGKFTANDLERAGLVSKSNDGRLFDRFFGRVMFPVMDRSRRVIGFGGRAIRPDMNPKYLNSPETETYKKSMSFYGINFAHDAIIRTKEVILVEGYFDFISLHRSGIQNVLATCGTTLSSYQVNYIEQNCNSVVFLYDMDEAGIRATMKNFELFSRADLKISVVKFDGAKDADEYINRYGLEKTGAAISQAQPFTRFLINYAYSKFGRADIEAKSTVVKFLAPHLISITSDLTRNQYIALVAQELSISEDGLREEVAKGAKGFAGADNKALYQAGGAGNASAASSLDPAGGLRRKTQLDLLHLVIQNIDYLAKLLGAFDIEKCDCPELRDMIELMLNTDNFALTRDMSSLFAGSAHAAVYMRLLATPLTVEDTEKYFEDLIGAFNNAVRKERIDELKRRIRETEAMGDLDSAKRLLQEVSNLQKEIINSNQ